MMMTECQSSNIHSHGHDPETNTLAICFRRGSEKGNTYHYQGVTKEMYEELKKAPSLGQWFHTTIRSNAEKHPGAKRP